MLSDQFPLILLAVLLCPALAEFGIRSWISLPPLFLCGATGVAAAATHLAGEGGWMVVSAPLLFGFAAALAMLTRFRVRWRRTWRRLLRFGYVLVLVSCALAFDQIRVPSAPALAVGSVTLLVLGLVLVRASRQPAHCGN